MASRTSTGFGAALRVREFRYLWAAELLSVAGDQLARVALALLVFARTSSAGLTALTYALTFVPAVLGGALLSGLADRFPRRRVLVVTDLLRAGLAGLMALPGLPLPVLWVVVGVLSAASGPFKAAQLAILPQVLEDRAAYRAGLALRQVTGQTAQLVGFAVGGVLLVAIGPHLALLLNAATFVASAVLIIAGVRERAAAARAVATSAGSDTPCGGGGLLWPLFALAGLVGLFVVPEGLAVPYAGELGLAAVGVGVLMAADPAGSVLGGWLAARVRIPTSATAAVLLAIAAGVPLVVCELGPGLVLSAALWALSGVFSTIYLVQLQEMVVDLVPDHRRGGVLGRLATCLYCSQGIAILGGGLAAEVYGPFRAVAVAGVVAIGLAGVIGVLWWLARSRRERVAGNEPASAEVSHHRSLLAIAGTSSPGTDCLPDPEAVDSVGDQGSGGDANSPFTSATQPPTASEVGKQVYSMRPGSWRLRRLPRAARAYLVVVEVAAVVATVVLAMRYPVTGRAAVLFAIIVGLGVLAAEATRRVERMRRRFSDTPHVNMSSVWTLSAALVTTPALAAATTVVLYLHLWHRSWRQVTGMHPFRVVFSVCAVVLSCHAAFLIDMALPGSLPPDSSRPAGLIALVLVIVAYWCVNSGLVAVAISVLRRDRSLGRLLGSWSENILEYATLSVGALTALLLSWYAWSVALVMLPLFVLHRSVLVRQLEHAATTDDKTGLLNAGTWRALADAELERALRHGTRLAVLMVDLDFFKGVNDRYGHLAGDQVLRAIAVAMRGVVRGSDLVGRFGGEEFVILLTGVESTGAMEVGNRICERVRILRLEDPITGGTYPDLRLTVSVGVATFPDAGRDVDELLMKADAALFAAKDAGRDRVLAVQPTRGRSDQEAGRSPL
ncbi:MFS transporter [Actinophytocola sp.]|uniref:MFS transporter n=1 Tax=Actinophytocola sp. TaxID=1872138 RepID=UPI003D6C3BD0